MTSTPKTDIAGWQPIETATHMQPLLLYIPPENSGIPTSYMTIGFSTGSYWMAEWDLSKIEPTHWMPLPDPPATA